MVDAVCHTGTAGAGAARDLLPLMHSCQPVTAAVVQSRHACDVHTLCEALVVMC